MMTVQEVLCEIRRRKACNEFKKKYFPQYENLYNEYLERENVIEECLEKQIPYELKETKLEDSNVPVRRCICGAYYIDEEFDGYCGKCGQRIKWNH